MTDNEALSALEIHRQRPELVLASLRDNLLALATKVSSPELSGPIGFFGQLAGWAAAATEADDRAAQRLERVTALRARTLELGVSGMTLGDLTEGLAEVWAGGNDDADVVLRELLGVLGEVEAGAVSSVTPSAGGASAPDVSAVSEYLAAKFGPGSRATSLSIITGGFSKMTLLVDVVLDGQAQQIVLRQVMPGYRRDALRPEFDLVKAVWSPDLPIPEPMWIEEEDTVVGGPFIANRRSPGAPLGQVSGAGGAEIPAQVIKDLAAFLARLHTLDASAVTAAPVLPMRTSEEVHAAIDDLVTRSRRSVGEPPPRLRAALGWLRSHVPTTPAVSVVHGDPGFQNTLAENGRMTAALDWERAHLGDAAEDLAYVLQSVSEVFDWDTFLAEYAAAGGRIPDAANMRFYLVWQDVWRHIECARHGANFYSSGIFSSAVAGFVYGPRFLDSALALAFPDPKAPVT
jgi:aminoglycoside phosphotransferase (APT) family kinase protein